jgi:hypothetical protein
MKALVTIALAVVLPLVLATTALAGPVTVGLGTTEPFALLAAAGLSNIPTSTISGNVGVSPGPGSSITGLTCLEVTGTIYAVDATGLPCYTQNAGLLTIAMNNLGTAYTDAFGRVPNTTFAGIDNQLGGQTLVAGVYRFPSATTANLIGNLTLTGDADDVWIFQATSDFVTASSSTVTLTGGAQACHVFWQVGSSATLNTSSTLRGTVLANTSITVGTGVTVAGRLFAGAVNGTGIVTLDKDTITRPASCVTQASINAAAAAAALAQAQAAVAAKAAADAQAAADSAAAAAREADARAATAAAEKAAAAAATAAQAAATAKAAAEKATADAAKAVIAKAAAAKAVKAAKIAKAAAVKARVAKAAAVKAATSRSIKLSSIRTARVRAGFTG